MNKTIAKTMSVRVGARHQVTIPSRVAKKLRIEEGSFLEVSEKDGCVIFSPQMVVPREDAWFWSPEWQKMEREADEDILAGRISGPYTTGAGLAKALSALKK